MNEQTSSAYDAHDFRQLILAGAGCLEANVDAINALNVFPVPDGDTGINMLLTLRAATSAEVPDAASATVGSMSSAIARGALLGARGNSGVIFSQFMKGLAGGLAECERADGAAFATALQAAADAGYQAVGNPVEGTMLSVMRAAAEAVYPSSRPAEAPDVLRAAYEAAERALAYTPEQLPVLKQAGVVDAGGQGVVAFLAGMVNLVSEEQIVLRITAPEGGLESAAANVSHEFLEHTEEEMYGYCTQFVVQGEGLDPDAVRERVMAMAASTVVVGDDRVVRVHAHAEDPGPLLSMGAALGALDQINIQNMDLQHQEFMSLHGYGEEPAGEAEPAAVAVIPVAPGDGIARVFRSLGAAATVSGGQTMNPSAADIIAVVQRTNAAFTIVLPNNKNIVLAAEQAAELADAPIAVVPSRNVAQGMAAMLAFNPDLGGDENAETMRSALDSVRSGEVTTAVRSTTIDGVDVLEGQAIAILDGALAAAAATPGAALAAMLESAGPEEGALVTLFYGAGLSEEAAQEAADAISGRFTGIEVEVHEGGQPHYHYLVSIE
ncbi:MAG: DAK2 domain-containing protein [Chloroflexota bacterium]|nr:DAK2 domain-containing protein [Chloroflexota bacterium]MDE2884078.1 DAK2 domain-containing protein [Chloroflexota bacterium]